jgi:hypothetical protein
MNLQIEKKIVQETILQKKKCEAIGKWPIPSKCEADVRWQEMAMNFPSFPEAVTKLTKNETEANKH